MRGFSRAAALFSVLATLGSARPCFADDTPSLVLEPAPAGDRAFALERAGVRGHKLLAVRLGLDYAREPLVLVNAAQENDVVVSDATALHISGSYSLFHRLLIGATIPVASMQSGATPRFGQTAPRTRGGEIGDLRLNGRLELYQSAETDDEGVFLAASSSLWLPTATEGYLGDSTLRARFGVSAEGLFKRLYWHANLGIKTRPAANLPGIVPTRVGSLLGFGLGAGFFLDNQKFLALGTEILSDYTVGAGAAFLDPRATGLTWLLTSHYRVVGGPFEVGAAFGPGLGQMPGSADFRALVMFGYAPESPPPPPDQDEDGIADKLDACQALKGVEAIDPLLNGCPEAPLDRDGDAIPDGFDACPTVAGEHTGQRKTHGCPKPKDTDGDGVLDPADECPLVAGLAPPLGQGCPKKEAPPPSATLVDQAIVISQQVQFETGTAVLRPESDAVLAEVSKVLAEHPEIEQIEVQGHTDDIGPPEVNRKLGQDRAESVVSWLVSHGAKREQLLGKGYGSDEPIASNSTEEGRAQNRRVEFRILRTKPIPEKPNLEPTKGEKP